MIYPDEDMKRWECCDTQVVLANANYYYTKGQVDEKLDEIDGITEEEVQTMINRSIRTKADKTDVNALSGQVEDNTEAIANTYTKREVDNAITAATAPVNNTLTAHTANTSVHVTSQEKTYWNNKLDASAYTPTDLSNYYTKQETQGVVNGAVSGKADTSAVTQEVSSAVAPLFGAVEYDSQTQRINFKHDATGQTIAYVDATDFIKDGMVSNVEIVNGNLVITFNSDAGKQPISIPLTDIFNPANYYTTAQTQSYVSGFTYDKATIDQKVAEGGTFDPDLYYDKTATDALLAAKADTATTYTKTEVDAALSGKADASALTAVANDVQTVSGQVATKVSTSDFNTYTAATATALNGKADTSAVTAVSDALTAHTANTTVHVTAAEKTYWNNKLDASAYTPTDLSQYWTSAQTQSAIDDAISGITGVTVDPTLDSGSTNPVANSAITNALDAKADKTECLGDARIDTAPWGYSRLLTTKADGSGEQARGYFSKINGNYIATNYSFNTMDFQLVEKSAVTSAITSASTNAEVAGAKAVYDAIQAGGGGTGITIDQSLDSGSTNPVANSAITQAIDAKVETSAITTSMTSSSTNTEIPSAKAVYDTLGGLKLVKLTQSEYDQLATKDPDTLYIITNVVS